MGYRVLVIGRGLMTALTGTTTAQGPAGTLEEKIDTLAYEYTWTNNGKSLAPVSTFLPAKAKEHDAHALLAGMTFGF